MSFLVEIDESAYPKDAINAFTANSAFGLDNARAMMWMSQLAYETADENKVGRILASWGMNKRAFKTNNPITGWPPESACLVAAGGRNATIFSFAGSDPLKIQDWITDFTVRREPDDLHSGFEGAVDSVWGLIEPVIRQRPATEQNLFFTGHSLGGALAIVAAERAMVESKVNATAVYTFGGPRVGGQTFFNQYSPIADCTFRLVHGNDVVPTVPPTFRGGFVHVGHCIQCASGDRFDQQTPIGPVSQNDPDIVASTLQSALGSILVVAGLHPFTSVGTRLVDQLATLLPPMARDHVPANYFRALSIPLR